MVLHLGRQKIQQLNRDMFCQLAVDVGSDYSLGPMENP